MDYADKIFLAAAPWVASAGADFYERSMQTLVHRW
jgi:hypothetical protein